MVSTKQSMILFIILSLSINFVMSLDRINQGQVCSQVQNLRVKLERKLIKSRSINMKQVRSLYNGYKLAKVSMTQAFEIMAPQTNLLQVDQEQTLTLQDTITQAFTQIKADGCRQFYSSEKKAYKQTCEKLILAQSSSQESDYCKLAQSEGALLQNRRRSHAFDQQEVCQSVYIIELMTQMLQYLKDLMDGDRSEEINAALAKVKLSQKQAKCSGSSKAAGKFWYWILQKVTEKTGLSQAKLIYRATKNPGPASSNYRRWIHKKHILIVCRSRNYNQVFGGYRKLTGSNYRHGSYIPNSKTHAFLFQANKKKIFLPNGPHGNRGGYSYYKNRSYWPTFGAGHDLYFNNARPLTANGYSNFGHSYKCPVGGYGSSACRSYLAGAYNFKCKEMEIFELTQ